MGSIQDASVGARERDMASSRGRQARMTIEIRMAYIYSRGYNPAAVKTACRSHASYLHGATLEDLDSQVLAAYTGGHLKPRGNERDIPVLKSVYLKLKLKPPASTGTATQNPTYINNTIPEIRLHCGRFHCGIDWRCK